MSVDKIKVKKYQKGTVMMDWAKRAVNYRFRKERLNSLPSQEVEFLGKNTRRKNFGIPLESPGAVPEFLIRP